MFNFTKFLFSALVLMGFQANAQTERLWQETQGSVYQQDRSWMPLSYKSYLLNPQSLRDYLQQAPFKNYEEGIARNEGLPLTLPMPDGSFQHFRVVESPIMDAHLAAKYPQIKTYAGYSLDDPTAYIRCGMDVFGFHAFVLSQNGTVLIDPYTQQTQTEYLSYYKSQMPANPSSFTCTLDDHTDATHLEQGRTLGNELPQLDPQSLQRSFAGQMRTYRLALACTGEYAAKFGSTKAGALSAMVKTMARVNGVYEKEFNIHMNLIPNTDTLIFLDGTTDPYTNNSGGTMLGQNQNTVTSLIGGANYDIGHVFSTGGGGIASLGCVCSNNNKARGVTGSGNPQGDGFDIDYVAHEMGHQFGGNHTFNSTTSSCGGGNRSSSTAYEPGSASTIMGYAGICGATNDLQPNSDAYFHVASFDEVVNFITTGNGNSCPVKTPTGNDAPVITEVTANYNIPLKTPFRLKAAATDPNNDTLTYCWEQHDLGPGGDWNNPTGNAPLFRSKTGTTNPTRIFPPMSTILGGLFQIKGDVLPTYARNMTFRCIVRDNKVVGGGVTYNDQKVTLTVVNTVTPFMVTTANTTGLTMNEQNTETITWDVSNTDQAPINTQFVNILLSIDNGLTFPYTLAANTPNDGSEDVLIPTGTANVNKSRIMVEAVGNVYFDINDKSFTIAQASGINEAEMQKAVGVFPNPSKGIFELDLAAVQQEVQTVLVKDVMGRELFSIANPKASTTLDLTQAVSGIYFVEIQFKAGSITKKIVKE